MKTLNRIFHIGILDTDRRIDSFSKILTNSMSILGIVFSFLVFLIFVFIKPEISLLYLGTTLIFIFPLYLNYKGFYKVSSFTILTLNAIVVLGVSFIGGFSMEIHPLLIGITLCGSLLFISFYQAFLFNVILLTAFCIVRNYSSHVGPMIEQQVFPLREYMNFSISIIAVFIVARFILSNLINYITTLEEALNNLKETNHEIATQNKRLELFNSIASHDLKTPVRNFTSFVTLAKRKIATENKNSTAIEHLDMALSYSDRMNELVKSISSLSDIKRVENEELLQIDLRDIIQESENYYQSQTKKKLVINCPEPISLIARMSHCKIISNNLITNAIKYNKSETIIIDIKRIVKNDTLYIKIKDNGIGVQTEYQQIIFDPFGKLHPKEEYEGTGLGLYIVKEVLKMYDGKIYIGESSEKGTTFTIELPQQQN